MTAETAIPTGAVIGHINLATGYRGGERQTELLIRQLAADGWSQRLVARSGGALATRCHDIDRLETRTTSSNALSAGRALRGVDVVHVHEGRSVYAGRVAHVLYRIPFLITRRIDNPFRSSIGRDWAYAGAAAVVGVSTRVTEILAQRYPRLRAERIFDAHADLASGTPSGAAIRARFPGKIIAGHIGALVQHHKGQNTIIEAARQLQSSNPSIQFVLLGSGKDEAMIRKNAAGLPNISFEGQVDNVSDYLAAFDYFVFPSLMEGLGSTLLDAMCFGLPIVASRVGGIPDVIEDGVNGLLVTPGDATEFRQALLRLMGDDELRTRMQQVNRRQSSDYSAAAMADRYAHLYREVLT